MSCLCRASEAQGVGAGGEIGPAAPQDLRIIGLVRTQSQPVRKERQGWGELRRKERPSPLDPEASLGQSGLAFTTGVLLRPAPISLTLAGPVLESEFSTLSPATMRVWTPWLAGLSHLAQPNTSRHRHSPVPTSSREDAYSCTQLYLLKAIHEAGQRRMMRADSEHASSTPVRKFDSWLRSEQTTLKFNILPRPDMRLIFLPRPLPPGSRKRSRAVADIDGEHSCMQKKKRRLRLFLITSRLSPQFSHPATNIVDRGSSKIAVWAKQKALGRNLLRKAAILNGIRRRSFSRLEASGGRARGRSLVEKEKLEAQLELAKLEFNHGSVDTYTRPVLSQDPSVLPRVAVRTGNHFVVSGSPSGSPTSSRNPSPTPSGSPPLKNHTEETSLFRSPNEAFSYHLPRAQIPRREYPSLPPSPLGLSNYDAFDAEDDASDPYAHLDDDDESWPNPFEDDDDDLVPFSPSAITTNSSTTARTATTEATTAYPEFSLLDHGQTVFGGDDQPEEGVPKVWTTISTPDTSAPVLASTSPDFPVLFATSLSAPKRTDSFAMSPNFRPHIPTQSVSPNFPSVTATASTALHSVTSAATTPYHKPCTHPPSIPPNLPPVSTSPDYMPTTATASRSPNFAPLPTSPNFAAIDAPVHYQPSSANGSEI
ncbi:hypothetical protein BDW02DRAFT_583958 [Decorospora gaudefroyi]|uniref:Uncharacterized protein n=1 Tax=Decorospora gaudefroyi TaxID=184978 RepID=A0A6A5K3E0_9PLEO|nr:hypothetical protein BDW02DRAFT_583958 [Decorospora gaudefroyi]